jgi:hypothetical protein
MSDRRELPPPLLCTQCVFYSLAQTEAGVRYWCSEPLRFHGTITEPEPRCAGLGFEPLRREMKGRD